MKKKRYAIIAAVLLLGLAVAWLCASRVVGHVLENEKLRLLICSRIGKELGGNAGLLPFTGRGFGATSPGLVVTAPPARALTGARAARLSGRFSLRELWRGKWRIDRLSADHLQVALGPRAARQLVRSEFPDPAMIPASLTESSTSIDIREVSIAHADFFWADPEKDGGQVRDVQADFRPDGRNLVVQARGGTFHQAKLPEAQITTLASTTQSRRSGSMKAG